MPRGCQWHLNVRPVWRVNDEARQEHRKIARYVIDMRRRSFARNLEGVAMIHLPWLGDDEDGRHSSFMRNNEIFRKILEHNGSQRINRVPFEEPFIGRGLGLWHKIGGGDVENILEHRLNPESLGGAKGVFARPIC